MDGVRQAVSGEGDEHRRRNAAEPGGGACGAARDGRWQMADGEARHVLGHPPSAIRHPGGRRCIVPTLTFAQLAEYVGGTVLQGDAIETSSVVIDSREVKPDSVFFAIKGERLDGHQFLPQALQTARGAVVARVPENVPSGKAIVKVDDTAAALQQLAKSIRERFDFLPIAVTG